MTAEEAKSHMNYIKEIVQSEIPWTKASEALEVASDALEKQIPRPTIDEYKGNVLQRTICPKCEHIFGLRRGDKFCPYCGQAIDWSEDNDH